MVKFLFRYTPAHAHHRSHRRPAGPRRWATRNLLDACAALTEDQFHHEFEMGTRSLHNNITHILGAMRGWTDVLTQSDRRARLEESKHSLDELKALHEEIADEFEAIVRAHPFDETVTPTWNDKTYEFIRGGIFPHVMTHSMHHRAQCLNMLRHLPGVGVEKLPLTSVLEWMLMGDGKRRDLGRGIWHLETGSFSGVCPYFPRPSLPPTGSGDFKNVLTRH